MRGLQWALGGVIPNADSGESAQNSEPNIAVNPVNPTQAVISSFGPIT